MLTYVDLYCERVLPGVLAEPLNAISNLAFILSFFILWRFKKQKDPSPFFIFLSLMVLGIGIGSLYFHLVATNLGLWLDIIPIFIFITVYLYWCNRFILKLNPNVNYRILFVFLLITYFMDTVFTRQVLAGSLSYFPTALALSFYAYHSKVPPEFKKEFRRVLILFLISLTMRTLDAHVCALNPWGLHFIWHILNAKILYDLCLIIRNADQDKLKV